MKALSIKPEFADMIRSGKKTIELRTWSTSYRGPLLICSTKPDGHARCMVDLLECRFQCDGDFDAAQVDELCADEYSWVLGNVREIEPIKITGKLGLFNVEAEPVLLRPAKQSKRSRTLK